MEKFKNLSVCPANPQLTCDLTPISIRCQTTFCWTKFFGWRKYLSKRFFRISGLAGSGKPGASQLGESLGQEESNDTSNMRIGPAVPPTHPLHYSYFNPIWAENTSLLDTSVTSERCNNLFSVRYLCANNSARRRRKATFLRLQAYSCEVYSLL